MNWLRLLLFLAFITTIVTLKPGRPAHHGRRGCRRKFSNQWKKPLIFCPPSKKFAVEKECVFLSCGAVGHPMPRILWFHKGKPLKPSKQIKISKMGTVLKIEKVSIHNRGEYMCKAVNKHGEYHSRTFLKVGKLEKPHIAVHPRPHQRVKEGQNIVIDCVVSGRPMPYFHWEFHGRKRRDKFLGPRGKLGYYHHSRIYKKGRVIVEPGRLIIRDSRLSDSGKYTCVGKVSKFPKVAKTHATVLVVPFKMTREHARHLKATENMARASHARQIHRTRKVRMERKFQVRQAPSVRERMKDMFKQNPKYTHNNARRDLFEHSLKKFRKSGPGPGLGAAPTLSRGEIAQLLHFTKCLPKKEPKCNPHSKYRTLDGTCNNLKHPNWGSSQHPFLRLLTSDYSDGFSRPVGIGKHAFYFGYRRPSPRDVSVKLLARHTRIRNKHLSDLFNHFCQFFVHDNDLASLPEVQIGTKYGRACDQSCKIDPPCVPIQFTSEINPHRKVPLPIDKECSPFVRASAVCNEMPRSKSKRVAPPVRTQVNAVSSFTDVSTLYGSSISDAVKLFDFGDPSGKAFTGAKGSDRMDSLPFANVSESCSTVQKKPFPCFKAGDVRSNSHLMMLTMHTMLMRLHNIIAGQLLDVNPHWIHKKGRVFQEARRIVIAIMQRVQYHELLPLHIGPVGMKMLGRYKGYSPKVNPTISLEVSGAGERVGHYMANDLIYRLGHHDKPIKGGHLPLHISGFNPYAFMTEGGSPPIMRGTLRTKGKQLNSKQPININLADHLFEKPEKRGMDLASVDIMRGRDFGFQSYNHYRVACGLRWAKSFDDLKHEIKNPKVLMQLKKLYGHPGNLDLVVGLALENPVDGATFGPTGRCITVEQLKRLRNGDRFWYENKMFTKPQLKFIKQFSLAKLICLTNGGSIKTIQSNVFMQPHLSKTVSCYKYMKLNMNPWRHNPKHEDKDPMTASFSERLSFLGKPTNNDNFLPMNENPSQYESNENTNSQNFVDFSNILKEGGLDDLLKQ